MESNILKVALEGGTGGGGSRGNSRGSSPSFYHHHNNGNLIAVGVSGSGSYNKSLNGISNHNHSHSQSNGLGHGHGHFPYVGGNNNNDNGNRIPHSTEELRRRLIVRVQPTQIVSVNDEAQLRQAFAHFVSNVPVIVDDLDVMVGRKAWAKAFYETDIISSSKCLFEALFTEEEMSKCTLNGKNGTEELCAIKMLAILRVACWMSRDKMKDPYFFNTAIDEHNVFPSKEEQEKIEKKVFTERRSQAKRKNNKRRRRGPGDIADLQPHDFKVARLMLSRVSCNEQAELSDSSSDNNSNSNSNMNSFDSMSNHSSSASTSPVPSSLSPLEQQQQAHRFEELEELYYRYPEEFLNVLLPNWRNQFVFIDGLLVDKAKWGKAFDEGSDPVKSAWTLFLALFSDEEITTCTLNGKNGTTELCPIKKLAILRAVEWMRQKQGCPNFRYYFDNDDETCNVFPSKEDKEKIETKVFTEKRYQQSRLITNTRDGLYAAASGHNQTSVNGKQHLQLPYN